MAGHLGAIRCDPPRAERRMGRHTRYRQHVYEVTSSDEAALNAIRSTYKDVRVAPEPATSAPIERI
jgi:hypothetical protein